MDLISRKTTLCTPREALAEMFQMRGGVKSCPKWFEKRLDRIGNYLQGCEFKGRPLLDVPMSMSAIDVALKKAWHAVSSPAYRWREFEQMLQDATRSLH